jgi:hypothetical protein
MISEATARTVQLTTAHTTHMSTTARAKTKVFE